MEITSEHVNHFSTNGVVLLKGAFSVFVEDVQVAIEEYIDMPELLQKARSLNHIINVCPIHEYWLDIGKPEFLKKAHNEWY